MGVSKEQYRSQLTVLLPSGKAWQGESQSVLNDFLLAIATEFERLDLRAELLRDEADIRATNELLTDWERVAGLPDGCTTLANTNEERRINLTIKMAGERLMTPAFYVAVVARLGYTVTIDEGKDIPYESGHLFNGVEITAGEWVYVWRVNSPATTVKWARAGSMVSGDVIRSWGNEILECVINRLKPAHTHVLFSYA